MILTSINRTFLQGSFWLFVPVLRLIRSLINVLFFEFFWCCCYFSFSLPEKKKKKAKKRNGAVSFSLMLSFRRVSKLRNLQRFFLFLHPTQTNLHKNMGPDRLQFYTGDETRCPIPKQNKLTWIYIYIYI